MTRFDEPNSTQRIKLKVTLRDPVDKSNPSEVTEPQLPSCLKTGVWEAEHVIWGWHFKWASVYVVESERCEAPEQLAKIGCREGESSVLSSLTPFQF